MERSPRAASRLLLQSVLLAVLLLAGTANAASAESRARDTSCAASTAGDRPQFAVRFGDEVSPYRLISHMVLPGVSVEFDVLLAPEDARFAACFDGTPIRPHEGSGWSIRMPREPGHYDFTVQRLDTTERATVRLFVLVPYEGQNRLGDFRIGRYETKPLRGLENYRRPRGFIRVERGQQNVAVSDHFELRQFLSKQPEDFPKYARVSARVLLKMERLLEEVRSRGVDAETFTIMSGFRTPWYNRQIGNTTKYSRHLYGDAIDLYVDEDGNGRMDDLDGDGRSNYADAKYLADLIEGVVGEAWYRPFIGGLGIYGPRSHRGAFVHIDTRGYRARWTSP